MNKCCLDKFKILNDRLADNAEKCLSISGNRVSVMEEAAYRKAEFYVEIMDMIKEIVKTN